MVEDKNHKKQSKPPKNTNKNKTKKYPSKKIKTVITAKPLQQGSYYPNI